MLSLLHRVLVVLLLVLQLFAPLVHAHAGRAAVDFGIHLPELEVLTSLQSSAILQSASVDLESNSLAVGINAGVQQKSFKETHDDGANLLDAVCFATLLLFSPKLGVTPGYFPRLITQIFPSSVVLLARAPRAPPYSS